MRQDTVAKRRDAIDMALFPVGYQDVDRDLLSMYGMDIMQGVDRHLRLGVKNALVSIPPHSSRKAFRSSYRRWTLNPKR